MFKFNKLFIAALIFTATISKANSAQIYTYNLDNLYYIDNTYYDPSITSENNKCLDGLLKRLPQNGDKETTEACLNTFGYNPDTNIKSPVMIVFEVGKPSHTITTTIIYKIKNQIIQEKFKAVGARYQQWYPEAGMYTLDYIKSDNSPSFKPAYANFYSPKGKKDKNGNPVNIGLHGREGNLMAGGGSNGCYRHRVEDMQRFMTIIKKAGANANLPPNWYENTLPVAFVR
ncbi:hypothetical protein RIVM261_051550 [Rivularia sp. IAM M-261]|nr:hypothetical protein RIVM261_051550 [Rivularia sp. IAM M-261]